MTFLVCDLGHDFPGSNLEIAISMKYMTWSQKKDKKRCSGVTFLSMTTPVWSYHYRNGDGVYLGHDTCWDAVLCFAPYTHWSSMRFAKFEVKKSNVWFELWSNLLHLFENIWNAEGLMEGWKDDARCDYTIWPRANMEHCGQIQYCISIQQWIALKIGTK